MTRARTIIFWVLAALLLAGNLVLAWNSLTVWRFWEDEAFNLTVPRNLLAGLGYTSDGALSGSALTPYDARISTGPAVLLPVAAVLATGIDPVIGARLVPLLYWVLLLVGVGMLGYRVAGRWAALVAVAVPLAFNTGAGYSPIQGPADLLGEIPAAALLVWALVVLPKRSWLAGLLVGLAIQAKVIVLLALPAFAVALFLLAPGTGWARLAATVRRSWVPLIFVALPTFLFELSALVSLGLDGFIDHLRAVVRFIRDGGQQGEPTTIAQKITTLGESWSVPFWAAAVVAAAAVVLIAGGVWGSRAWGSRPWGDAGSRAGAEARPVAGRTLVIVYLWTSAVGALAFIGWWATASHLPLWVRHPSPGIFAFFPVLAAIAVWGCRVLVGRGAPGDSGVPGVGFRVVGVVAASVLVIGISASATVHVVASAEPRTETLATQRAAIAPIAEWVAENDVDWLAAEPWGAAVAPIVLSGAHLGLFDAPNMDGVPRLTGQQCATETVVAATPYRVCAAP